MNHGDMAALMKGIAPVMRETVVRAVKPVAERLRVLELREPAQGKPGEDGLGFDDLEVVHDGERSFTFRLSKDGKVREFPFTVPVVLDRGVYKADETYFTGDAVTWGGSLWIAQKETTAKPDTPDSGFRLAVKRGRDGKDAK